MYPLRDNMNFNVLIWIVESRKNASNSIRANARHRLTRGLNPGTSAEKNEITPTITRVEIQSQVVKGKSEVINKEKRG